MIDVIALAALGIAGLWVWTAERLRRDAVRRRIAAEREAEIRRIYDERIAQAAVATIRALQTDNAALREQLRRKGVVLDSAFGSDKRFHRARFERGIELLRGIGERDTSSVTADAVTPSPQGEGFTGRFVNRPYDTEGGMKRAE